MNKNQHSSHAEMEHNHKAVKSASNSTSQVTKLSNGTPDGIVGIASRKPVNKIEGK